MKPEILQIFSSNYNKYIGTREHVFNLYKLAEHVTNCDVIFDEPSKEDEPVELLLTQALTCQIFARYRGYTDELGRLHIVDAPNLKELLGILGEMENSLEIPIMTKRRLNLGVIEIKSVDWEIRNYSEEKHIENCAKLGITIK